MLSRDESRAHARAALRPGPSPGAWTAVDTPLGCFLVAALEGAIIQSGLPGTSPQRFLAELEARHPGVPFMRMPEEPLLRRAAQQLQEYANGERATFDLPLRFEGTEFQKRVWATLATIPYGKTWTYGELARQVGRPAAFRAVGQANHQNPLAPFIPCHRVINAGGGLGGYGGGMQLKKDLLRREGIEFDDA